MRGTIHLHGISRPDGPVGDGDVAVSRAGVGLVLSENRAGRPEYKSANGGVLWLTAGANASGVHFWVTLDEQVFLDLGGDQLEALFAELVREFQPMLARSLDDLLIGVVELAETAGAVEFLDWIQYFSPAVVARYGADPIGSAPFAHIRWTEDGGCFLRFAGSPFEEIVGRVAAADALGITLRPAVARNPRTGAPVVLPWS